MIIHFFPLEWANLGSWGDVTTAENKVPSPVTICYLLGVPRPSGPPPLG